MKTKLIILAMASSIALTACAADGEQNPWGMGNKQTVGTLGGAVLGGLAGSAVGKGQGRDWAIGAGVLLGAFAGSQIGKSLDQADLMYHQQAVEQSYSAPMNKEINWSNPDSGHSGSVTPVKEGHTAEGNVCRQYKQTIIVDGHSETALGTACKNNDGTWTIRNS